jgi:hypothetical protein
MAGCHRAARAGSAAAGRTLATMSECHGLRLSRVIRVDPQEDSDVRVLAVELFEDGLGIRYALPSGIRSPEGPDEPFVYDASFSVSDDAGTQYTWQGGGASGHPVAHGVAMFTPPVPESAQSLTVVTRGAVVTVDLR